MNLDSHPFPSFVVVVVVFYRFPFFFFSFASMDSDYTLCWAIFFISQPLLSFPLLLFLCVFDIPCLRFFAPVSPILRLSRHVDHWTILSFLLSFLFLFFCPFLFWPSSPPFFFCFFVLLSLLILILLSYRF